MKLHILCSFFRICTGSFYTWLIFFTLPPVLMVLTNIRYMHSIVVTWKQFNNLKYKWDLSHVVNWELCTVSVCTMHMFANVTRLHNKFGDVLLKTVQSTATSAACFSKYHTSIVRFFPYRTLAIYLSKRIFLAIAWFLIGKSFLSVKKVIEFYADWSDLKF